MIDLSAEDQQQLFQEMTRSQEIMAELFTPDQLNVAAIGNKTPQLHIHIIARYENDPAWPLTVWDHPIQLKYSVEKRTQVVSRLEQAFKKISNS